MNWSTLVPLALALGAGLGFVFVYGRGYAAANTITLQKDRIAALLEAKADADAQIDRMEERLDASAARNLALEQRNRDLLDMVTGRPDVADLRESLEAYAGLLRREHSQLLERLTAINHKITKGVPDADKET